MRPGTTGGVWEDIALEALKSLGRPDGSLTIEEIAHRLGLRIVPTHAAALMLVGNTIMVSPRLSAQDRRVLVAQALAHWLIERSGFGAREEHVQLVTGVLLARSTVVAASPRACLNVLPGELSPFALRGARGPRPLLRLHRGGTV